MIQSGTTVGETTDKLNWYRELSYFLHFHIQSLIMLSLYSLVLLVQNLHLADVITSVKEVMFSLPLVC